MPEKVRLIIATLLYCAIPLVLIQTLTVFTGTHPALIRYTYAGEGGPWLFYLTNIFIIYAAIAYFFEMMNELRSLSEKLIKARYELGAQQKKGELRKVKQILGNSLAVKYAFNFLLIYFILGSFAHTIGFFVNGMRFFGWFFLLCLIAWIVVQQMYQSIPFPHSPEIKALLEYPDKLRAYRAEKGIQIEYLNYLEHQLRKSSFEQVKDYVTEVTDQLTSKSRPTGTPNPSKRTHQDVPWRDMKSKMGRPRNASHPLSDEEPPEEF